MLKPSSQVRTDWTEEVLDPGARWRSAELELQGRGVVQPLGHSLGWAEQETRGHYRLIALRPHGESIAAAVAVRVDASRVLPGHRYLRVERLGEGLSPEVAELAVDAIARMARNDPGVLRATVRVFARGDRSRIREALGAHGFVRSAQPQAYARTLTLDLSRSETEILAGLHKTARKNLRHADRAHLKPIVITDGRYASRLHELQAGAIARTHGEVRQLEWSSILNVSRRNPERSRVVGLTMDGDDLRPEALMAFGWGTLEAGYGTYSAAGTMRSPGHNLPLSYPLLWELILWAKRGGAQWFDLGGVTEGNAGDPLKGITDFKRYFSRTVEEVSEEWAVEPHPKLAKLATMLGQRLRDLNAVARQVTEKTPKLWHGSKVQDTRGSIPRPNAAGWGWPKEQIAETAAPITDLDFGPKSAA